MAKDRRYSTVKVLIETGNIKSFAGIFDHIPKSVVYADLGMNYTRFTKLLSNPALFTLQELITLAGFMGIDPKIIIEMAYTQHLTGKKTKNKGK
ncbi:MAG: hypothetical protein Q8927_08840 [Bacteroidota bacterium]|nr:hypothetical protein [Bacteroidota bacterium]MDP4244461.1 hypothetical protein [Bacteroidota bacterium]